MGQDLHRQDAETRRIFDRASDVAGMDLAALCFRGPFDALSRTVVLQPAITAVNLACLAYLESNGVHPWATAGHSLGEYSALACAGVVSVDDALRLAAVRGRCMDDAARKSPGTMAAIVGLDPDTVAAEMARLMPRAEAGVANVNAPDQVVVSGTPEAVERAGSHFEAMGARVVPLPVSGAWHSEMMAPAEAPLRDALSGTTISAPRIRLYLNVTGRPALGADGISEALVAQLRAPVLWVDIVRGLIADGITRFVEVGPGKVLRGTLRRIWPDASAYEIHTAGDLASLRRVVDTFAG
jgi:[acyl-carrier-protein] S-malonyltransferase